MARPSTWRNSVTKLIRVPEVYAQRLQEIAHLWEGMDGEGLNEYRCPDCGLLFHGRQVQFDGALYRYDEQVKGFIRVE